MSTRGRDSGRIRPPSVASPIITASLKLTGSIEPRVLIYFIKDIRIYAIGIVVIQESECTSGTWKKTTVMFTAKTYSQNLNRSIYGNMVCPGSGL